MKRIIKAISILLAAAVLMASLCVTASASLADDLKKAKVIDSGSKVSFKIKGETRYYKIEMAEKGTLKINYTLNCSGINVKLIKGDRSGYIKPASYKATVGSAYYSDINLGHHDGLELNWSNSLENGKGAFSYELDKGTYYIRFSPEYFLDELGKSSFKFTYPQAKDEEESEGKITGLSLTMEKGDKLQLGALIDGEGTVKWSTSKKSVATVSSKGVITAKSKGEATITAKLGSSSVKIKIIVK